MTADIQANLTEGAAGTVGKILSKFTIKALQKLTVNEVIELVTALWEELPEDKKDEFFDMALSQLSPENVQKIWDIIKEDIEDDVLTDEDKDALVRKLGIDRSLLDGVDTVLTAVSVILEVAPTALGVTIDTLELTPIDELCGLAFGGVPGIVALILSIVPEGTIIGGLASAGISISKSLLRRLKDILIHDIIPEPAKKVLGEAMKRNTLSEDQEQIFYVIKDSQGHQLSAPNSDDEELWDRVSSMEARGHRGLQVVVYTGKKESCRYAEEFKLYENLWENVTAKEADLCESKDLAKLKAELAELRKREAEILKELDSVTTLDDELPTEVFIWDAYIESKDRKSVV